MDKYQQLHKCHIDSRKVNFKYRLNYDSRIFISVRVEFDHKYEMIFNMTAEDYCDQHLSGRYMTFWDNNIKLMGRMYRKAIRKLEDIRREYQESIPGSFTEFQQQFIRR